MLIVYYVFFLNMYGNACKPNECIRISIYHKRKANVHTYVQNTFDY